MQLLFHSNAVSLGSTEDYTSSPKPAPTALPAFSQRFSSASSGVAGHGAVSLPGFTSSGMAHRASPYSPAPAPAPAHTPSLSYLSNSPSADSSVSNTALWGNYDTGAALQQYGVVASGNSAASRGRTPTISAAASLTASKYSPAVSLIDEMAAVQNEPDLLFSLLFAGRAKMKCTTCK
jgi:hypothetical protein